LPSAGAARLAAGAAARAIKPRKTSRQPDGCKKLFASTVFEVVLRFSGPLMSVLHLAARAG